MLQKIRKYISEFHMLSYGDKVVAGISGGADSVCLFFVLLELRELYDLSLAAVHVNHGLRGPEAEADEEFVRRMCREYDVRCEVIRTDVRELAVRQSLSEEEAGRRIRYDAFDTVLKQYGYNKIAVAHNRNDQSETVLFNLFRGSGLKGLSGIAPVRGNIIRPLLDTGRDEIETYLLKKNITYRTDRTNLTDKYTRNKIRLKVMPYVTDEINGRAVEHIAKTAGMVREYEEYIERNTLLAYKRMVSEKNGQYFVSTADFAREDPVIGTRVLRKILEKLAGGLKDIGTVHMDSLLELMGKQAGRQINLPYSIVAVREYHGIRLLRQTERRQECSSYCVKVPVPGEIFLEEENIHLTFQCVPAEDKKNSIIPKNDYTKWFDYDKIKNTVFLRCRQEGDFLQIDGKGNTKRLKAYFINARIPKEERNRVPLLADGSHIIWVIGGRISEAYKVDENTKNILIVQFDGGNEDVRQD